MWNNVVSYVHTGLQTAILPLAAMAHEHPLTTLGITMLFVLLFAMLAAEIVEGRTTAARFDEVGRADAARAHSRMDPDHGRESDPSFVAGCGETGAQAS